MIKSVRAASVQFNHRAGDKPYNLGRIAFFCEQARERDVSLIAFPEMCVTGYWHVRHLTLDAVRRLSESLDTGDSVKRIRALAEQYQMIVGAGLIEQAPDGRLYNAYVCALPDGRIYSHRKLHCFISGHLSSGSDFTVFTTPEGVKIGILICWDNNLVENVRITALKGADILLAPHQTGGCRSRSPYAMGPVDPALWHNRQADPERIETEFKGGKGREWLMRWLPSRAHDNGLFVVFSNGVGLDDDEVRTGNAMLIDCYGRILAETWKASDDMVIADLDLSLLPLCTGRRWIRGRRPELYTPLTQPLGHELDPISARFSNEAVGLK